MTLKIQTGEPAEEGRYIVYTPCRAVQIIDWCEPSIATWHGGRWHCYDSVTCWIGPLPVVNTKTGEIEAQTQELWPEGPPELDGREYDL